MFKLSTTSETLLNSYIENIQRNAPRFINEWHLTITSGCNDIIINI